MPSLSLPRVQFPPGWQDLVLLLKVQQQLSPSQRRIHMLLMLLLTHVETVSSTMQQQLMLRLYQLPFFSSHETTQRQNPASQNKKTQYYLQLSADRVTKQQQQ